MCENFCEKCVNTRWVEVEVCDPAIIHDLILIFVVVVMSHRGHTRLSGVGQGKRVRQKSIDALHCGSRSIFSLAGVQQRLRVLVTEVVVKRGTSKVRTK